LGQAKKAVCDRLPPKVSRSIKAALATFCIFALWSTTASAQSERGNITGLLTDPSGAAIAGAQLTIVQTATNAVAKAQTTGSGEYNAPNLPPGVYRIEVSAPGFKRFVQQNVTVSAGGTVRIDAVLQVRQVSDRSK
jgi:hypothetical protein